MSSDLATTNDGYTKYFLCGHDLNVREMYLCTSIVDSNIGEVVVCTSFELMPHYFLSRQIHLSKHGQCIIIRVETLKTGIVPAKSVKISSSLKREKF